MSIQIGMHGWRGAPPDERVLASIERHCTRTYCDLRDRYTAPGIAMVYRGLQITPEDRFEQQPMVSPGKFILTWDGRLDNREDLARALNLTHAALLSDAEIVLEALEEWKEGAFGRLVGDWALTAFDCRTRRLYLARDFIGTRGLYFRMTRDHITWCTDLAAFANGFHDALGTRFRLNRDYVSGYLTSHPDPHATPYREIEAVPPGCWLEVCDAKYTVHSYWQDPAPDSWKCAKDADYERDFLHLFRQSVARRLRSAWPVAAELSGGMDSSSIVCLAHQLQTQAAGWPRLVTLTYYDPQEREPNDDLYYCSLVERSLGECGYHIAPAGPGPDYSPLPEGCYSGRPAYAMNELAWDRTISEVLQQTGARTLMSGIGGDELLGGVPSPYPELVRLLTTGRFFRLAKQLQAWSLAKKWPLFHLVGGTLWAALPLGLRPATVEVDSWLRPAFARDTRMQHRLRGATRSEYGKWAEGTVRQLMAAFVADRCQPPLAGCHQRLYPFLDSDLYRFLAAVPRDQLLRPGERRSLMRRTLVGILPEELRIRKTKALGRSALAQMMETHWDQVTGLLRNSQMEKFEIADAGQLGTEFIRFRTGKHGPSVTLVKSLGLEIWLRHHRRLFEEIPIPFVPEPDSRSYSDVSVQTQVERR